MPEPQTQLGRQLYCDLARSLHQFCIYWPVITTAQHSVTSNHDRPDDVIDDVTQSPRRRSRSHATCGWEWRRLRCGALGVRPTCWIHRVHSGGGDGGDTARRHPGSSTWLAGWLRGRPSGAARRTINAPPRRPNALPAGRSLGLCRHTFNIDRDVWRGVGVTTSRVADDTLQASSVELLHANTNIGYYRPPLYYRAEASRASA